MDELIARLESATEGSRELDVRIAAYLVGGEARQSTINYEWCVYSGVDRSGRPKLYESRDKWWSELRRAIVDDRGPTRSIDAALTLVPEGWAYQFCTPPLYGHKEPNATLYPPGKKWHKDRSLIRDASAKTMPLALCIAALRARQVATP